MRQIVGVVGTRKWGELTDMARKTVRAIVMALPQDSVVVSGGAKGVDQWAAEMARARGLSVIEIKPDWKRYGLGAGKKRNAEIVQAVDRLVAVWDGCSKGTAHTVELAAKRALPIEIYTPSAMRAGLQTGQLACYRVPGQITLSESEPG